MKDRLGRLTATVHRMIIGSLIAIGAGRIGVALGFLPERVGVAIMLAGAVALVAGMLYVAPQSMTVVFGAIAFSAVPIVVTLFGVIAIVDRSPRIQEALDDQGPLGMLGIVGITLLLVLVGSVGFLLGYRWLDRRFR